MLRTLVSLFIPMQRADEATRAWVAGEVLEYLMRHPDAQDTLDGVCDWWLLE